MSAFQSFGRGMASTGSFLYRSVVYVVLGTVLVAVLISTATAVHVWMFARQDARPASDTIFVLGAAQYDGEPSSWLRARLDHAASLDEEGVAPTIVTVGGSQAGDRFTEAQAGKTYLEEEYGISADAIVEINEGVDTLTSAQAFSTLAQENGWESSVVVTDPGHSLRATTMVQDVGITATGSPTRQGPAVGSRAAQLSSILHETGGLLYYKGVEHERENFRDFVTGAL